MQWTIRGGGCALLPTLALLRAAAPAAWAQDPGAAPGAPQRPAAAGPQAENDDKTVPSPVRVEYLAPDRFRVPVGQSVLVHLVGVSDDGPAAVAWPVGAVGNFFVRGPGTQDYLDQAQPLPGTQAVAIPIRQPGATLIGRNAPQEKKTLTRAEAEALVRQMQPAIGDDARWQAALAQDAVPLRIVRSTKLILRTPDQPGQMSEIATSKTGQPGELRPLMDPTAVDLPCDVAWKFYGRGVRQAAAHITARHLESGATQTLSFNRSGLANLHLDQSGTWRVELHYLEPPGAGDEGEWTLHSSVLVFATREGASS